MLALTTINSLAVMTLPFLQEMKGKHTYCSNAIGSVPLGRRISSLGSSSKKEGGALPSGAYGA